MITHLDTWELSQLGNGAWSGSTEQVGDERASWQAREKKKILRKKEERREVGERERKGTVCLMREEREV